MKQFQVPQFITIEDKVIGPFTIKQFLYIAMGAGLILAAYTFLQTFLFFLTAVLAGTLAGSLAFLKVNEQPFPLLLKNAILYLVRPRLYIWRREEPKPPAKKETIKTHETSITSIPKLSASKLVDLAWSLDIEKKLRE
ncbi:MAG: PrgI family protein [Patescibacteria group bacterium]